MERFNENLNQTEKKVDLIDSLRDLKSSVFVPWFGGQFYSASHMHIVVVELLGIHVPNLYTKKFGFCALVWRVF